MNKNIEIKFEKSNNDFAILPEINFVWNKGYYFFIFIGWLKWRCIFINND